MTLEQAVAWQNRLMIVEEVAAFIRSPEPSRFDELALQAFTFQYQRIPPYQALCDQRQLVPGEVSEWRQVPSVPALAFKSLELAASEPQEIFRSSGTTGSGRSLHHHPFPELYRQVIEATFPQALGLENQHYPILSLIPSRAQVPDSSLSFMADHVMTNWGASDSLLAIGERGVEVRPARGFLATRQRDRRPALILATAFALIELLDALERLDLRFRLPGASRIFETGGTKGRTRELERAELLSRLQEWLGVAPDSVVREYGMTELTSHFYTRLLTGGDPDLFVPPPWVRVRILDPESLEETAPGQVGLISVFDLANIGSAVHVLTEDLGVADGEGFRLVGRAAGAELRGCSLTVEELTTGKG